MTKKIIKDFPDSIWMTNVVEPNVESGNFEKLLKEILAILNGDGGHYTSEYGMAQAIRHGIGTFYSYKIDAEELYRRDRK